MKYFQMYLNSFKGLSREIWFLALVTFINRAGTMVVPFMTIYLKTDKHFSYQEIAWIMSAFGLGSMLGAWIGGKLIPKIGFYKLMYLSLFSSGIMFVSLQFLDGFVPLCFGVFFLMLLADAFRPASYLAINAYSSDENKTRSISLLRLAINLGFSFGPALGGLLISKASYASLFWLDGITCILAGIMFLSLLKEKTVKIDKEIKQEKLKSPYKDYPYLLLIFIVFLTGFCFLQYFSTIPLYYKEVHHLSENQIGLLMFLNGFLIFLVEMPLIKFIESRKISINKVLIVSFILISLSFLILNLFSFVGILVLGMLFVTVGEMFNFPFMNAISLKRAQGKNTGDYMALYTMAFSLAHILSHNSGLQLIRVYGYEITWYVIASIMLSCILFLFCFKKLTLKTNELEKN